MAFPFLKGLKSPDHRAAMMAEPAGEGCLVTWLPFHFTGFLKLTLTCENDTAITEYVAATPRLQLQVASTYGVVLPLSADQSTPFGTGPSRSDVGTDR